MPAANSTAPSLLEQLSRQGRTRKANGEEDATLVKDQKRWSIGDPTDSSWEVVQRVDSGLRVASFRDLL